MAPQHSVDRLVDVATRLGAEVTRLARPGGHGITPDEVTHARTWVESVFRP